MVKLKNIELINPLHIKIVSNGCGEFPDGYKLTEEGILLLQEYGKQCFEAGQIMQFGESFRYEEFEDYLKSLKE